MYTPPATYNGTDWCIDCVSRAISGPDVEGFMDCMDCGASWIPRVAAAPDWSRHSKLMAEWQHAEEKWLAVNGGAPGAGFWALPLDEREAWLDAEARRLLHQEAPKEN